MQIKLGGRVAAVASAVLATALVVGLGPAAGAGSASGASWLDRAPAAAGVGAAVAHNAQKLPPGFRENLRYVHADGTITVMVALARRTRAVEAFVERAVGALRWYGDDPRFYGNVDQSGFADVLRHPAVTFVEPDYPLSYMLSSSVVDVHARGVDGLWDFAADDSLGALYSNVPDLGVEAVTGKGVTVAVVDSGIDRTHRDFGGWDCAGRPYQPCESRIVRSVVIDQIAALEGGAGDALPTTELASGHGTHVAGIVAGNGYYARNGEANPEAFGGDGYTIGMAPQAELVSVKVGDGPSAALGSDALQWTLDHAEQLGIRVSNNSWGCLNGCAYAPGSVLAEIQRELYEAGVVTVFAAGNGGGEGSGAEFSGRSQSPFVLSVASYDDETDTLSGFSSRGERDAGLVDPATWTPYAEELAPRRPDIAAPGASVWSAGSLTGGSAAVIPRVDPADVGAQPGVLAYTPMSGTSMATPHVSGAAALLVGACPSARPLDVMRALLAEAEPRIYKTDGSAIAEPFEVGYGALDVRASLEWLRGRPACRGSGVGTLAGSVFEKSSGDPVEGALVACAGLPDLYSDATGSFYADEVPPAMYRCTARAAGVRSKTKTVVVEPAATATVNFDLKPAGRGRGS